MKLSSLSSSDLKKLLNLIGRREKLAAAIVQLEIEIDSLAGEPTQPLVKRGRPARSKQTPIAAKAPKGRRGSRKGRKRGQVKAAILSALSGAGATGLSVKELSAQLKLKIGNLRTWFYTTGKKVKGLKKTGGKYTYQT